MLVVLRKDLAVSPRPGKRRGKDRPTPKPRVESSGKSSDKSADKAADTSTEQVIRPIRRKTRGQSRGQVEKPAEPLKVTIDFENIRQRILALPSPRPITSVSWPARRACFSSWRPRLVARSMARRSYSFPKFDLKSRKTEPNLDGVAVRCPLRQRRETALPAGRGVVYRRRRQAAQARRWALKTAAMEVYVEPRGVEPDVSRSLAHRARFFLRPPFPRARSAKLPRRFYAPFLDGIASRDDLNYLFTEMLGNITVGHMFIGGGEHAPAHPRLPAASSAPTTRSKTAATVSQKIYNGENWNPELKAPLTQPGVNVKAGEYLAGRQWPRSARHRQYLQLLRGDRRQAGGLKGRTESGWHGFPRSHRSARRQRARTAQSELD